MAFQDRLACVIDRNQEPSSFLSSRDFVPRGLPLRQCRHFDHQSINRFVLFNRVARRTTTRDLNPVPLRTFRVDQE